MSQTRLTYLIERYLDDTATPEELEEVMLLLEDKDNEQEVKIAMDQYWKEKEAPAIVFSPEKTKSGLEAILELENPIASRHVEMKRKWLYAAAAAVVLLLGSAAFYKYALIQAPRQNIAESANTNIENIGPGGHKAVLTLADKSTIVLEKAAKGVLIEQGNAKIVKQDSNGPLAYVQSNIRTGEIVYNSIATPRGGEYQLVLSDGSKAWLNSASSLRFPATFGNRERKVEVMGEVYFEVAKDASKPFIVGIAGKGEVKVLGTHFNINAYSDEAVIATTLLEGSVQITSASDHTSQTISPGEQAQLTNDGKLGLKRKVNTEQVIAWKNGLFNFSKADLLTILRQLSRWYDLDIVFEGPVPKKDFGGELQRDLNLSQVLRLLEISNMNYKIEGKKLTISNK